MAEDLLKLSILLELMTQMFSGWFGFGTIKLYDAVWICMKMGYTVPPKYH